MKNNLADTRNLETTSSAPSDSEWFNNLYKADRLATTDQDSAIQTYFEQVTGDTESARLLTASIIFTAQLQNINPMKVLSDFKKLPKGELDITLATFLNLNRVNTSLLGTTNTPRTGFFVNRTILA